MLARRIPCLTLLACLATLALGLGCAEETPPQAAPRQPHIVLLLADDLGWGDVGYHGGEIRTPHIDRLAREGVRLERFYAQPVCSPSRAALLTGRYPIRLGMQRGVITPWSKTGLPLEERTLAEALRDAGYATAICGKWHLGLASRAYLPTARGFERQYGHYTGGIDYYTHERSGAKDWNRDDQPLDEKGYATHLIAAECGRIVSEHDPTRPLFLYVPFNAPHTPLQAPKALVESYAGVEPLNRRRYCAMVTSLDEAVGSVLEALDARGMREDTLVLFVSDNGGSRFGDNGELRGGKGSLYEGGVRVPALASWPGVLRAGACETNLHLVDLFPTLTRLAGGSLAGSAELDGRDAWPTIAEGAPLEREELLLNVSPSEGALIDGRWKLLWVSRHHRKPGPDGTRPDAPLVELFDVRADPGEQHDRSADEPERTAAMLERLRELGREAARPQRTPDAPPPDFRPPARWGHR